MDSTPLIDGDENKKCGIKKIALYGFGIFIVVGILTISLISMLSSPKKNPLMKMIFVNDIHIDPYYQPTGIYDDSQREYCRKPYENVTASKYGKYGCDAPIETFISMAENLKAAEPKPDFIVFGGDSLGHGLKTTIDEICGNLTDIFHNLTKDFKNVPLLFTIGNNDLSPDYGNWTTDAEQFEKLNEIMKGYLTEDQQKTFKKGGYYSYDVPKQNLLLLVLNTVIYAPAHDRTEYDPTRVDPYDQFAWIKEQVAAANKQGRKLGLLMHIPPAIAHTDYKPGFHAQYADAFYDAIQGGNINFILVSHTHKDQIIPLHDGKPFYHTLSAASITPSHSNNPGFRVYELENAKISNYRQYFADIRPNPTELKWELEYDFNSLYGMKVVDEDSISGVVKKIQTTSRYLWLYREMLFANADVDNSFYICALNAVTEEDFVKCTKGVNNLKRLYP